MARIVFVTAGFLLVAALSGWSLRPPAGGEVEKGSGARMRRGPASSPQPLTRPPATQATPDVEREQDPPESDAPARRDANATVDDVDYDDLVPQAFPPSLDAVPMTAWRQDQLDRLDAQHREIVDYKLGLLDRFRSCADPAWTFSGQITAFFRFSVDEAGNAIGDGVELLDSDLPEEVDQGVLACLSEAHAGATMPWAEVPPTDGEFHWASDVAFPLEQDPVYEFFAH